MNFEARFAHGKTWKRAVDAIKDLIADANFSIDAHGISMQAPDATHVLIVKLQLDAAGFDHYRVARPVTLGLNLANVAKIMRCSSNDDDAVTISNGDRDDVQFMMEDPKGRRVTKIALRLLDIESDPYAIPDIQYQCVAKMDSTELQRIFRDLAVIGTTVTIRVTKRGLVFSCLGDMGKTVIACPAQLGDADEADEAGFVRSFTLRREGGRDLALSLSLKHLLLFTKATSLSKTATLHMTGDMPFMLEYPIGDHGYLRFYLGPRLEEEEEEEKEERVKTEEDLLLDDAEMY